MRRKCLTAAIALLGLATALLPMTLAREVREHPDPEKQAALDAITKASAVRWQAEQPEIAAWAAKGKPFIPWACHADDLPQAGIPAFPGAEGGGMYSFGGRGGSVLVVTNLDDHGPGSYREALEAVGPRIVVFAVAGIIHLDTPVEIRAPYITIAGQTAPGDGICIAGPRTTNIETHDVVIRYLRYRRGANDSTIRDHCLSGDAVGNVIVDHCSCSWGMDENISLYKHIYHYDLNGTDKTKKLPVANLTIQWTITSEALNPDNHAFGGTWGGTNDVFHHNLLACNVGRNSSIGMGGDFNFINNVVFNWQIRTLDGGDDTTRANIINSYFKPGPETPSHAAISYRIVKADTNRGKNVAKKFGIYYVDGNIVDGNKQVTKDNWDGGVQALDVAGPSADDANPDAAPAPAPTGRLPLLAVLPPDLAKSLHADKPYPMAPVTIQSANDAYESVLDTAGATLPKRDAVDERVINEVRTGKVTYKDGIITDISQVGGYPDYKGEPVTYPDKDGIPDWWKTKFGLTLHDATVATADANGDGYSNIEKYLNGLDPSQKVDWKDLKNNHNTLEISKLRQ